MLMSLLERLYDGAVKNESTGLFGKFVQWLHRSMLVGLCCWSSISCIDTILRNTKTFTKFNTLDPMILPDIQQKISKFGYKYTVEGTGTTGQLNANLGGVFSKLYYTYDLNKSKFKLKSFKVTRVGGLFFSFRGDKPDWLVESFAPVIKGTLLKVIVKITESVLHAEFAGTLDILGQMDKLY